MSDVATFHASRMTSTGEILLRTTKAGTHVSTWVPEWLQECIKNRAKEVGPLIFGAHTTKDLNVITDVWRRKLNKLWKFAKFPTDGPGRADAIPLPAHLHTHPPAARRAPQRRRRPPRQQRSNFRKHYAAWIPERQERLTNILKDAFNERPKPKLVEMPAR